MEEKIALLEREVFEARNRARDDGANVHSGRAQLAASAEGPRPFRRSSIALHGIAGLSPASW